MTAEEKKARIEKTLFGDSLSAEAMERELRLFQEELEEKMLGQYAAKSVNTKGRQKEEEKWRCNTPSFQNILQIYNNKNIIVVA